MTRGGGRRARTTCPVCGRVVAVSRTSERIFRHTTIDGPTCRGTGMLVDLYGTGPAPEVEP